MPAKLNHTSKGMLTKLNVLTQKIRQGFPDISHIYATSVLAINNLLH